MNTLTFDVVNTGRTLTVSEFSLVVAGYTGRDEAAVQHHIDELAAMGIPPPAAVPVFFPLDPTLATQAAGVDVAGDFTSGEVEPVLIVSQGVQYLTVGSDHTDRDLERRSIADSKAVCPKPLARTAVALEPTQHWDDMAMSAIVDGRPYQRGTLASLRPPPRVLEMSGLASGSTGPSDVILFGGTVPLLDGEFVAGQQWHMTLSLPDTTTLELRYDVRNVAQRRSED